MTVIDMLYPDWRNGQIHESSPCVRGTSDKLRRECAGYLYSQFDRSLSRGEIHPVENYRCEDLEHQTFPDGTFDLVVTQDVFEHLFDPFGAEREILRTLRPGGLHVFSCPIVLKNLPSRRRANLVDGQVVHFLEPQYHGNPIDEAGSLVTIDWGYDIVDKLAEATGAPHCLFYFDDITRGLRAEYIEVLVMRKPLPVALGALAGRVQIASIHRSRSRRRDLAFSSPLLLKRLIDIRWHGIRLPLSPSDRNHTVEQKLGD